MIPYSVVIIKATSIRRGLGPDILSDLLTNLPVCLRYFREWTICNSTWNALADIEGWSEHVACNEISGSRRFPSWICLFTSTDRETDPTESLNELFGPSDMMKWLPKHLRYKYSVFVSTGRSTHPSDTVFHVARPDKVELEAMLLFKDFDKTKI